MSEYLDVVNENNRVIYNEAREKVHASGLWHRGIHILVFNLRGHLLLQMRSSRQDNLRLAENLLNKS